MPDIDQLSNMLPGSGMNFCLPVSAANALMWMAANGYPNLAPAGLNPESGTPADRQKVRDFIKGLATDLNTDPGSGTTQSDFVAGMNLYFAKKGYINLKATRHYLQENVLAAQTIAQLMGGTSDRPKLAIGILKREGPGISPTYHAVTLTGVKGVAGGPSSVSFNDPESDESNTQQSQYTTVTYPLGAFTYGEGHELVGMKGFRGTGNRVVLQEVIALR
ncbi:hypothetical protein [Streptomyces sp. NPDC005805]|uniref:hypothetical protein n=1 Tax=Streptomyces sp. NPDC005805 TaxID=3157068 RepID=UPI0033C483A2